MEKIRVIISNQQKAVKIPTGIRMLIRRCCHAVLQLEGFKDSAEISVSFVDNDQIQEMNRQYRNIDAPTDVLSFECDSPFGDEVPDGEVVELGDVILCPAVIAAQAPDFNTTPADEFRLMLVHGMLHLLGYDHIDPDDATRMEDRELVILRSLAQVRGIDPQSIVIGPTTSHLDD